MVQPTTLLFLAVSSCAASAVFQNNVARAEPTEFTADPAVGPGGDTFKDSNHFRIYGPVTEPGTVDNALNMMEAAYDCFVNDLGWRSTGLSFNNPPAKDATGPFTKTNIYSVDKLDGALGVQGADGKKGIGFLTVLKRSLADPSVTVHEFGHVMTYHEKSWVEQGNTGAWWETTAEWVADTFKTSDLCAAARTKRAQKTQGTDMNFRKVIGESFKVIVDGSEKSSNHYDAWPFLTYLTTNPDKFDGLGNDTMRQMFRQFKAKSNETPLHVLSRMSTKAAAPDVVGKYWARMAYVDIGHPQGQAKFLKERNQLNFANVDLVTEGNYKVKDARQPRYMGANIIPLTVTGAQTVNIKVTGAGDFKATLAVRDTKSGAVKYTELVDGAGSAPVAEGEEASLVVANTPKKLIVYDPFAIPPEVAKGLDYSFTITGASVKLPDPKAKALSIESEDEVEERPKCLKSDMFGPPTSFARRML